jgi:hypothetical protein
MAERLIGIAQEQGAKERFNDEYDLPEFVGNH